MVRPSAVGEFTETHDRTLWQCLSDILKVDPLQCDEVVKDVATLPLSMGGLGLRNSGRMWHKRHPQIAVECLRELGGMSDSPTLEEASMRPQWCDGFRTPFMGRLVERGAISGARAGVLARKGFSVESVAARICRKAGGRVTRNILVRDLDLDLEDPGDARRLEVVVDGLPRHGGSQLAVDTTLVSALRGDGSARAGADRRDGVALIAARRRKERRYPELVGWRARARLGRLCWRAQLRGRWLRHSWNFPKHQEQMGDTCAPRS